MRVTVDTYRGYDIEFDTDSYKFLSIISEEDSKESKSYPAVKKWIDDYLKENNNFKPFLVVVHPTSSSYGYKKEFKVIGIRKDNRFIGEDKNGDKFQLSIYDERSFILHKEENVEIIKSINLLDEKLEQFKQQCREKRMELIDSMDIVGLKEYKKSLIKQ